MKTWQKYREYLWQGQWHIHTNYTDGKNSVLEYCEKASNLEIPLLAFTEHVNKELTYDFDTFLQDIQVARCQYPDIIILSGCEAKVLPNWELNVDLEIIKRVDYPIFAYHSFPNDLDLYIESIKHVVRLPFVNTWAHPGNFIRQNDLEMNTEALVEILELLKENNVLIEINKRHDMPSFQWKQTVQLVGVQTVRGDDIHNLSDLK